MFLNTVQQQSDSESGGFYYNSLCFLTRSRYSFVIQTDCFPREYFLNIFGCCGITTIDTNGVTWLITLEVAGGGGKIDLGCSEI